MRSQRGNILFLILLAIILFVALTVSVRDSMKGGGKNVKDERAQAIAATVNDMVGHTAVSLQRFLMSNGYTIENIDMFATNMTAGSSGNANSCSTAACNLFDPAGGNVSIPILPAGAKSQLNTTGCSASYFTTANELKPYIMNISVRGVGTDLPDVVLYYCGVDALVCEALNVANSLKNYGDAGIDADYGTTGAGNYSVFSAGTTNPIPATTVNQIGLADARINGQHVICSEWEKTGTIPNRGNGLIAVLLAR